MNVMELHGRVAWNAWERKRERKQLKRMHGRTQRNVMSCLRLLGEAMNAGEHGNNTPSTEGRLCPKFLQSEMPIWSATELKQNVTELNDLRAIQPPASCLKGPDSGRRKHVCFAQLLNRTHGKAYKACIFLRNTRANVMELDRSA